MPPTQPSKTDRPPSPREPTPSSVPAEVVSASPVTLSSTAHLTVEDLPKTGVGQAFTVPLFGQRFFRTIGRAFGFAATLLLLASIALVWFGWSWFGLASQFFIAFFVGEGVAALLDRSSKSAGESN